MSVQNEFSSMPDAEVMLRVRRGSEDAFAELYQRYHGRLLDFFHGMSRASRRDGHMAEDLCHETFLRVWRLRRRYEASGKYSAYLFTIARHIWLERCRQARKDWRLGVAQSIDSPDACPIATRDAGPDDLAHRAELDERILAALSQLPEEQRMAFVLRTVEGLSLEDISNIMECPVNTVRSRRLLAIRRLREALRELLVH